MKYIQILIIVFFLAWCSQSVPSSVVELSDEPIIDNQDQILDDEPAILTWSQSDHLVVYTNEWYDPIVLNINLGERVEFINLSTIPLQVSSDPHPVHTDYEWFDAYTTFWSWESFAFTFDKAGTYSYHNHMKSLHKWVIRIMDSTKVWALPDKTLPASLVTRDELLKLLDPYDSSSIRELFEAIKSDPKLVNDCHDMAHDLWHRAYELYGFSRALTYDDENIAPLNDIDELCAWWYMHGVLEEVFLHDDTMKNNPEKACASVPQEHQWSCYHGVWHGIMFAFDRNLHDATAACRAIEAFEPEHRCYEWVYMELFWGQVFHADWFLWRDSDDPLWICASAPYHEQAACYLYSHLWYLRTHKHDYQWAMDLCMQSKSMEEYWKQFCIKWIWITTMKSFAKAWIAYTETFTNWLSPKEKEVYYEWMVWYALLSGMSKTQVRTACNLMKIDSNVCNSVLRRQE